MESAGAHTWPQTARERRQSMNEDTPFYTLVQKSPFTALLHVHDAIWNDKAAWTLSERDLSCAQLRSVALSIAVERINESRRP